MGTDDPDVTTILKLARGGDASALDALLPLIYDELLGLARGCFRQEREDHTLQPTAVVHEAYARLVDQKVAGWDDRAHFFGVAARCMRQILIDHARRRGRDKRGGGRVAVTLHPDLEVADEHGIEILDLDEALGALQAHDERKARVVELRFFSGLATKEIAEELGVSVRTVEDDWYMARAWLKRRLRKDRYD